MGINLSVTPQHLPVELHVVAVECRRHRVVWPSRGLVRKEKTDQSVFAFFFEEEGRLIGSALTFTTAKLATPAPPPAGVLAELTTDEAFARLDDEEPAGGLAREDDEEEEEPSVLSFLVTTSEGLASGVEGERPFVLFLGTVQPVFAG